MRIFVKCSDVMKIMGCSKSQAYNVIKKVNERASEMNTTAFPRGTANKYLFADMYGIPSFAIDQILEENNEYGY